MPGRTEREAFNAYADPLKSVLACLTSVPLRTEGSFRSSDPQFVFVENPARLSGGRLHLFFRQSYHLARRDDGKWKVTTDSYEYAIESEGKEVVAFHWDPRGKVKIPHLHCGALDPKALIDRKTHLPSGRVPVEDIVWFAIAELGLKPLSDDWLRTINTAREKFMISKTW